MYQSGAIKCTTNHMVLLKPILADYFAGFHRCYKRYSRIGDGYMHTWEMSAVFFLFCFYEAYMWHQSKRSSLILAERCIRASVTLAIMSSNNGLLPVWHQAIIWTNDGLFLIGPFETNLSEIWIKSLWNGSYFVKGRGVNVFLDNGNYVRLVSWSMWCKLRVDNV